MCRALKNHETFSKHAKGNQQGIGEVRLECLSVILLGRQVFQKEEKTITLNNGSSTHVTTHDEEAMRAHHPPSLLSWGDLRLVDRNDHIDHAHTNSIDEAADEKHDNVH